MMGKKIKVITTGQKVMSFSDAVLQAGGLYSYRKAFYLFELHRFNCQLFFLGFGELGGVFLGGHV